jgi:hypothetical protein
MWAWVDLEYIRILLPFPPHLLFIDIFCSSELTHAIVEGEKAIELNAAQKLSVRFNVPLAIFLD